jgi:hypothetical protein
MTFGMAVLRELEWKLDRCCLATVWRTKSSAKGAGEAVRIGGVWVPLIAPVISTMHGRRLSDDSAPSRVGSGWRAPDAS